MQKADQRITFSHFKSQFVGLESGNYQQLSRRRMLYDVVAKIDNWDSMRYFRYWWLLNKSTSLDDKLKGGDGDDNEVCSWRFTEATFALAAFGRFIVTKTRALYGTRSVASASRRKNAFNASWFLEFAMRKRTSGIRLLRANDKLNLVHLKEWLKSVTVDLRQQQQQQLSHQHTSKQRSTKLKDDSQRKRGKIYSTALLATVWFALWFSISL